MFYIVLLLFVLQIKAADNCYNYMSEETVRNLVIPKIKDHDTKKLFEPGLGIDDSDCFVFDNSKKDGYYFIKNNQLIHMSPKKKSILLDLPADKPINSLKSGPPGSGLCCFAQGNQIQIIEKKCISFNEYFQGYGQAYADFLDENTVVAVCDKKPKQVELAYLDVPTGRGILQKLSLRKSIFAIKRYDSNVYVLQGYRDLWFIDKREKQDYAKVSVKEGRKIFDISLLPSANKALISSEPNNISIVDLRKLGQFAVSLSTPAPANLGVANQDSQKFNLLYREGESQFGVEEWNLEQLKHLKKNKIFFTNSVRKLPKLKVDPFNSEKIAAVTEDNVCFSDRKKIGETYLNYSEQEREECLSFYNSFDKQKYEKPEDYINMLTLLENIGNAQKEDSTYNLDKNTYRTYKLLPKLLQKGFDNLGRVSFGQGYPFD